MPELQHCPVCGQKTAKRIHRSETSSEIGGGRIQIVVLDRIECTNPECGFVGYDQIGEPTILKLRSKGKSYQQL